MPLRSDVPVHNRMTVHQRRPTLRRPSPFREVANTLLLVIIIYGLVNLASSRYLVQGKSMYPSFDNDQVLYVSRLAYLLAQPQRLDIVVFHHAENPPEDYIKRIVGLPGDTVAFSESRLFINGLLQPEPYIMEPCHPSHCPDRTWTLGPDQFFVLGDNRNNSSDSRIFGPVQRHQLVGAVLVRYWPPHAWGLVARIGAPDSLAR